MKFMLLFQLDEMRWTGPPATERDGLMTECDRYAQERVRSGHARQMRAGASVEMRPVLTGEEERPCWRQT